MSATGPSGAFPEEVSGAFPAEMEAKRRALGPAVRAC